MLEADTADTHRVINEITAERKRQMWDEGWSPAHDNGHRKGEMAGAAACYLMHGLAIANDDLRSRTARMVSDLWPWVGWWKPKNRRNDLVRAAALIVAEIERLDRATVARMAEKLSDYGAPKCRTI